VANVLMNGNSAIGEAAIRAGCQCYFGYPITPQNELTEYMATHLSRREGCSFVQAESEVAAINMERESLIWQLANFLQSLSICPEEVPG